MKPGEILRLTDNQERHLEHLKEKFEHAIDLKYRRGAIEHGGNLEDMDKYDLMDNLLMEVLDLWVYAMTLKEKL